MKRLFILAGALLCAAAPRVVHAAQIGYDTLVAHRGESVGATENTLPAYETAVEAEGRRCEKRADYSSQ